MKLMSSAPFSVDRDEALEIRPIRNHAPGVVLSAGDVTMYFDCVEDVAEWAARIVRRARDFETP